MTRNLVFLRLTLVIVGVLIGSCGPGIRTTGTSLACPLQEAFSTKEDYQYVTDKLSIANRIRNDGGGLVYAVGTGTNASDKTRWLIRRGESVGAKWETVDDYALDNTENSEANDFHADHKGNQFAVGFGKTAGKEHWIVRRKKVNEEEWSTVDDFVFVAGQNSRAVAISSDGAGKVYVAGYGSDGTSQTWLVRVTIDEGVNWSTIDSYQFAATKNSIPTSLAVDSRRQVYVVGSGVDSSGSATHWLVRKLINEGSSWTIVDDFHANLDHGANDIVIDSLGTIYVTGYGQIGSEYLGYTRKSTNQGATWASLDAFDYSDSVADSTTVFWGLALDRAGSPYVVGSAEVSGKVHWIVRSSFLGAGWTTIDDFQQAGGESSFALGAAFDVAGNFFVSGHGIDQTARHWLTRVAGCQ